MKKEMLKLSFVCVLVLTLLSISAYAVVVDLGTAADFAVLGGSAVTNIGSSTFIGDVGSSPTETVTGITADMVTGNLYLAGEASAVKLQARTDWMAAYTTVADPLLGGVAGPGDLGGASPAPGVYIYGATAPWTSGTLTLDGGGNPDAQWIFQIGSTLITPSNATVLLTNGASANNVYWAVGTSATLGTGTAFVRNILALASIGIDGGGTLDGRALAGAAVTISSAEDISVPTIVPEPATLCLLGFGALSLLRRRKLA
jgi:hypothetical protein